MERRVGDVVVKCKSPLRATFRLVYINPINLFVAIGSGRAGSGRYGRVGAASHACLRACFEGEEQSIDSHDTYSTLLFSILHTPIANRPVSVSFLTSIGLGSRSGLLGFLYD